MIDGPITYGIKKLTEHIQENITDFVIDLISVFPILAVISFGVYVLIGMISKRSTGLGVVGVFLYGGLIIII